MEPISLNYFVLKSLQVGVRTTTPDVLSSVKKLRPLFRGPVLLKKSEPSLRGEGINTHTLPIFYIGQRQLQRLPLSSGLII